MDSKQKNSIMHRNDGIALKDYVDTRIESLCKAIDKAEETLNARLAGMNEFRETLRDQAGKFVTRDEVTLMLKPVCEDLRNLRDFTARHEGKASQNSVLFATALALIALGLAILRLFVSR